MRIIDQIVEMQKQYSNDHGRDAKTIRLPLIAAMDVIKQNPRLYGPTSARQLSGKTLLGMRITIIDDGEITLGD